MTKKARGWRSIGLRNTQQDDKTCLQILDLYHPNLIAEIKAIMAEPESDKRQVAVQMIAGAARELARRNSGDRGA